MSKPRIVDVDLLLAEVNRVYTEHYANSHSQAVHDLFNAVTKRIRNATIIDIERKSDG